MPGDLLRKRKIAVLGSRSVGKSSLVIQYIENHFVDSYYPTIESTFTKNISNSGVEFECDIIDTAGQDEFSIINNKHAIGIHGYVLVYSVASRHSLEMVKIIYDKIVDYCGLPSVPCVLVGAKLDLTNRQVQPADAEALAKSLGSAWIETSAKTNTNVAKVFELCLAEIEKKTNKGQIEPKPSSCALM